MPKHVVVVSAWRVALGWECYASAPSVNDATGMFVGTYPDPMAVDRRVRRLRDKHEWNLGHIRWLGAGEHAEALERARKVRPKAEAVWSWEF